MKDYNVYLYPGYGVDLISFKVTDVYNEQEALEKLCANLSSIFFSPTSILEDDELEYCEQHPELYLYIDATSYGGKCGYLMIENMRIEEA